MRSAKFIITSLLFTHMIPVYGSEITNIPRNQIWSHYSQSGGPKALAVGENGTVGMGNGALFKFAAKNIAKRSCRKLGGVNCQVVYVDSDLVLEGTNKSHWYALHSIFDLHKAVAWDASAQILAQVAGAASRDEAISDALIMCRNGGGGSCQVLFVHGTTFTENTMIRKPTPTSVAPTKPRLKPQRPNDSYWE